jgi:uncharacterized protein
MYIEQLQKYKINLWLYLPLPLAFFALMLFNFAATDGTDTTKVMADMIKLVGKTGVFVISVGFLAIFFFIVLFYNKFIQNNSLRLLTTSRQKIDWSRILFSFFLWGIITTLAAVASYYYMPEEIVWNFNPKKFFVFAIFAILLLPLQTSFEEYLFRGHMMQGLGLATKTKWIPLLVSSFLFGLMHIANPEVEKMGLVIMVYYVGTGFFLGAITLADEGLELALGFHAANNLFTALLITSNWSALQTHSVFLDFSKPDNGLTIFIPVFVVFPILFFVFSKKYKWNSIKERLFGELKSVDFEQNS